MPAPVLLLLTFKYPFGTGESFIANELEFLSKKFNKIYLLPLRRAEGVRAVPPNVETVFLFESMQYSGRRMLARHGMLFLRLFLSELLKTSSKVAFLKLYGYLRSSLLQNIYRAEKLSAFYREKELNADNSIIYSFWLDDWATAASVLKLKGVINYFISRVHGHDLYADRWPNKVIPFRYFQVEQVSKVFCVSKDGLNYLQAVFPRHKRKFFLSHLNVFDKGINPFNPSATFTIVSCSNIISLKRVHLIAEVMSHLSFNVQWVHFGDGELKNDLLERASKLPPNISCRFMGNVSNRELIDFYSKTSVNLFVHFSETEGGVPVALQEAASFGIPLMACDTGGVPEIVNSSTGMLLPVDFDANEAAQMITHFRQGRLNSPEFRAEVKKYWAENFNAEKTYQAFYENIVGN